jgi:hypothetical protein
MVNTVPVRAPNKNSDPDTGTGTTSFKKMIAPVQINRSNK